MKNYNDTIGNRTRGLPACSAVPQPTAPPRAPIYIYIYTYLYLFMYIYIRTMTVHIIRIGMFNHPHGPQDGARTALFQISCYLCCSVVNCVVLCIVCM